MKTIAVLLLSLVLVDAAFASIIGQMKGIFVCDTKSTYDQAVDMIRQHNWDAVDRLVLSGRCTQIKKGDVVVENVAGLLVRGMGRVLGDLAALGYDAEWTCLRASDVGAPHRRARVRPLRRDHVHRVVGVEVDEHPRRLYAAATA